MSAPGVSETLRGGALLRAAFREHAAGVAVVTAARAGRPTGFTATSLSSVSAEPPVVSFGVGVGSSSWPVIAEAEHLAVHVLGAHQRELAETFASKEVDRFAAPTSWRWGPHGVPVLDGVSAWLVCRVIARVPVAGHRVVLAEVDDGRVRPGSRPLLYQQGRFRLLRD
ncbi:flavin reductase family protein [Streptomyces oceani]|uniref:Flavin reductase n=1 Tax=Streptomyces oceani TaxID=1075402 RepID=A0A1E7JY18_9ACTN|nr:flavin reductase family protein [Streptomyces oceani]OEU96515.1 flavin reductase [Streptomyces oceani]